MILVTFTRQFLDSDKPQAEYKWFETVEQFIDWLKQQGDLVYSLTKGSRSFTQHGWVKKIESPAQVLQATDTSLKMVVKVNKVIADDGILFEDVKHCSGLIVDWMALKCEINA